MKFSSSKNFESTELPSLTLKELSCLEFIAYGWSDERIGTELALTSSEVETNISSALGKLGVSNRVAGIARASRLGLFKL